MKHKVNLLSAVLTLVLMSLLAIPFPAGAAESKAPQHSAALDKAKQIKVSDVKFDGLPLAIVITMLHDECVKRDPSHKGIVISLGPDAKQFADTQIKLEIKKEVTLAEVLKRIADSVGLKVEGTDTEILLVRKTAKQ